MSQKMSSRLNRKFCIL